jgi:hypothetical protein
MTAADESNGPVLPAELNQASAGHRESRTLTVVFGVVPICLVLIEGLLRGVHSWDTATAVALVPPIICGATAWIGARRMGRPSKLAVWWTCVAVFAYYAWWIVIAGIVRA